MGDADDSLPGTNPEERDEDATLIGSDPEERAVEEPTRDSEQEARGTYWMIKQIVSVGLVSVGGTLLVVVGLALATGLLAVPAPLEGVPFIHWAVMLFLGIALLVAFAWSRLGT